MCNDTEMSLETTRFVTRFRLVDALLRGIAKGDDEIAPGQSILLKWLSRLAPRFIFGQLNKGAIGSH